MSFTTLTCPSCGSQVKQYQNPFPTVDIIIELDNGIILIERRNEPLGWALPGGFVDYGETLEQAAVREAREETSLEVSQLRLVGCYSDPARDPRMRLFSVSGRTPLVSSDLVSCSVVSRMREAIPA